MNDVHDELMNNEPRGKIEGKEETISIFKNIEMSNELCSASQPLFQLSEDIHRMWETICSTVKTTEQIFAAQQNLCDEVYSPAMQQMIQELTSIPLFFINTDRSSMLMELQSLIKSDALRTSMMSVQRMCDSITAKHDSLANKWFQSFDYSPFFESLRELSIPGINPEKIKKIYFREMYDAHWFPEAILYADMRLTIDIIKIIGGTRKSKNRVKKIDGAIYEYYKKHELENIKKEWSKLGLSECLMRILRQTVNAYYRKEYAVTVIVLSTQWEDIICKKAHDNGRKTTKTTKKYFSKLLARNGYTMIFKSYYDDYIMYNCNSSKDTIVDVPGRHSAAHGFYASYPTRKAALNAILFTHFLLKLEPLEEDKPNG